MIKEAQLIKLAQSGNSTAFGKLVNLKLLPKDVFVEPTIK